MPPIGLAVPRPPQQANTYDAVLSAVRIGYRHLEFAYDQGNEADIGR